MSEPLAIERLDAGEICVLRISGDLQFETHWQLIDVVQQCVLEERCKLVINMSALGMITYMGAGCLIWALRQVRAIGGDIKIVGLSLYAERLFRMMGIHRILPSYESEAAAIQEFHLQNFVARGAAAQEAVDAIIESAGA